MWAVVLNMVYCTVLFKDSLRLWSQGQARGHKLLITRTGCMGGYLSEVKQNITLLIYIEDLSHPKQLGGG